MICMNEQKGGWNLRGGRGNNETRRKIKSSAKLAGETIGKEGCNPII